MHDTLFVVYRLNAFFIIITALLVLVVAAQVIQFIQIRKLKNRVAKLFEGNEPK